MPAQALLAFFFVFVVVLGRDGSSWLLSTIPLGSGLGSLVLAQRAREDEARDPGVLQVSWSPGAREGMLLRRPREWGDEAPAGAIPPAA